MVPLTDPRRAFDLEREAGISKRDINLMAVANQGNQNSFGRDVLFQLIAPLWFRKRKIEKITAVYSDNFIIKY
jgi:hypothetical protein